MSLLQWKQEYSVADARMDEQHKKLLAIVNELYDALQDGRGFEVVEGVLRELTFYVQQHFAAEEELMLYHGYPEEKLRDHRREHEVLLDQARLFDRQQRAHDENLAAEVLPFLLGDWLMKHILTIDKQYIPYLTHTP